MQVLVALALALLSASGCALSIDFAECNSDSDCAGAGSDGGAGFCTSDHYCSASVPDERLCPAHAGSDDSGAFVLATLMDRQGADPGVEGAVRLAVEEIAGATTAHGARPLRVLFCDSFGGGDASLVARVARFAIGSGAQAFVGPTRAASEALDRALLYSVGQALGENGAMAITPSLTLARDAMAPDQGLLWRTAFSDAQQGARLAQLAAAAHPSAFCVAGETDAGNEIGLFESVSSTYRSAPDTGIGGAGDEGNFLYDGASPKLAAEKLSSLPRVPSDVALVPKIGAASLVSALAASSALSATRFYLSDAGMDDAIFGTASSPVPDAFLARLRGVAPALPEGGASDQFAARYMTRFGAAPTIAAAAAYDAAYLIAVAAAAFPDGPPTGTALSSALRGHLLSSGAALDVGPASYSDAVAAFAKSGVRLDGASGPLIFDSNHDRATANFPTWSVDTSRPGAPKFSWDP